MFESQMLIAAAILSGTFIVFALGKSPLFRVDRAGAAIIGAALTIGTGVLSFDEATKVVDYKTIVILFSMMIVTAYLKLSGFFQMVGNFILKMIQTKQQFLFAVIVSSGILSAFFINDIICLLFTPIILLICNRTGMNPVPYLIGVATASNIGSAGTLIGNPQNILIGSLSGLSFATYFTVAAPLAFSGLFLNYFIILRLYCHEVHGAIPPCAPISGVTHRHLIMKSLGVTVFILAGFVAGFNPVVVTSLGAAYLLITRRLKPNKVYASIDFNLLVVFIGLFVVIGGIEHSGLMRWAMQKLSFINFDNFMFFSFLTITLSNIFSNVPAILLLKFFVPAQADSSWWIGMGIFSTFAGNLTLTGSIANLIVVEIAKRDNVHIGFMDYLKVGFPLTVLMTTIALLYFSIFYAM
jgi:Na+/H+ antiporter NhaD/arsenite permease-like protein